jgi:hypothetical protein
MFYPPPTTDNLSILNESERVRARLFLKETFKRRAPAASFVVILVACSIGFFSTKSAIPTVALNVDATARMETPEALGSVALEATTTEKSDTQPVALVEAAPSLEQAPVAPIEVNTEPKQSNPASSRAALVAKPEKTLRPEKPARLQKELSKPAQSAVIEQPTALNYPTLEPDFSNRQVKKVEAQTFSNEQDELIAKGSKKALLESLKAEKNSKKVEQQAKNAPADGLFAGKDAKPDSTKESSGEWLTGQVYPSKAGLVSFFGNKAVFRKGKELASFEVGKSLPNGETVRKVDVVNMTITTDRRTIVIIDDGS